MTVFGRSASSIVVLSVAAVVVLVCLNAGFLYLSRHESGPDVDDPAQNVEVKRVSPAIRLASEAPDAAEEEVKYTVTNLETGEVELVFDRVSCGCTRVMIGDETISPGRRIPLKPAQPATIRLLARTPQDATSKSLPTFWKLEAQGPPNGNTAAESPAELTISWERQVLEDVQTEAPYEVVRLAPDGGRESRLDAVVLWRRRFAAEAQIPSRMLLQKESRFEVERPLRVIDASVVKGPSSLGEGIYETTWRVTFAVDAPENWNGVKRIAAPRLTASAKEGDPQRTGKVVVIFESDKKPAARPATAAVVPAVTVQPGPAG